MQFILLAALTVYGVTSSDDPLLGLEESTITFITSESSPNEPFPYPPSYSSVSLNNTRMSAISGYCF